MESTYTVIETQGLKQLIKAVNEHISMGYEPQGGISVLPGPHGFLYYQAMAKGVQLTLDSEDNDTDEEKIEYFFDTYADEIRKRLEVASPDDVQKPNEYDFTQVLRDTRDAMLKNGKE